ncbi:MAG: gamma-glutamyltransferase family protein [Armatimonadota bacterium]
MYTTRPIVTGRTGVIAAGHHLAISAGLKMFALGGNAVDAGVAAGLALAVLKPHENGLGGECPILIYSPSEGKVVAVNGQGTAPKAATLEWFREHGMALIPGDGLLAATVPAMFGAYAAALARYGRLTLGEVLAPAIALAGEGYPVYGALHNALAANRERFLNEWPSTAAVYLPDGKVPAVGAVLRNPALARTLQRLAAAEAAAQGQGRAAAIRAAVDCFYRGAVAGDFLDFARNTPVRDASGQAHTALLDREDFAGFATKVEAPVAADYRGCRVFKCGPWTQGPVFLQQLRLLEGFPLRELGHNTPAYIHAVVECAKLAFADRERYYGDPEFVEVPFDRLFSEAYAREQRARIDPQRANNDPLWDESITDAPETYTGDTTHLDVIDGDGLMMSATPSGGWIPTSPVIPALGFPPGTRAQVFSLREDHPNGLRPGKRPRTTLTPSLAFRDGKPWIVFGTPGGDAQDQWTLQFFLNAVDFGLDLQAAIDAPSFHTDHFINSFYPKNPGNGTLFAEDGIPLETLRDLQAKGHRLHLLPPHSNGEVCAVAINPATGLREGAASSKGSGQAYAAGW